MNPNNKLWNDNHKKLNRALRLGDRDISIDLFLRQHATVHSADMANTGLWSFEDEILNGLTEDQIRTIPAGGEHSIAWILFHLSRIEDITMSILVAGTPQLFTRDGWGKKMNVTIVHSANRMDAASLVKLSSGINIKALKAYRAAVGRRTRQIVKKLQAEDFKRNVDPSRLQQVLDEGAVSAEAMEIIRYWGTKTIGGLLLMPPTRHCILHWNEALKIRKKLVKEK